MNNHTTEEASHQRRPAGGDDGDRLLASPPSGLFDRIEEAAAVPVVTAPVMVEYSIDADDIVVSTGGDWRSFAEENDGDDIGEAGEGLSLWSQIEGEDARSVWKRVVSEVRRSESSRGHRAIDGTAERLAHALEIRARPFAAVDDAASTVGGAHHRVAIGRVVQVDRIARPVEARRRTTPPRRAARAHAVPRRERHAR